MLIDILHFHFRPATSRYLPLLFFFVGASFWIGKGLIVLIEGGTLQGIVGNFMSRMDCTENELTEIATVILQRVSKINGYIYCFKLFVMHFLPLIHAAYIIFQMCAFADIQFQINLLTPTQDLLFHLYYEPSDIREDSFRNVLCYLNLLYITIVSFYALILDMLLTTILLLANVFTLTKNPKLTFGSRVLLYMVKRNVDSLLMREIYELSARDD